MNLSPAEREGWLQQHLVGLAEEQFPDDIGLQWSILACEHRGPLTGVTVEPSADVGYPRFVFLISFEGEPAHIATYAEENGVFPMLSYTPGVDLNVIPRRWE